MKQEPTTPTLLEAGEAEAIVRELAAWSKRNPRGRVYHYGSKDKMDGDLIALEERAKAWDAAVAASKSVAPVKDQLIAANEAQISSSVAPSNGEWIPLTEQDQPERNTTAIYWTPGLDGTVESGYPAIADEWRWEHHGHHATHFLRHSPPSTPNTHDDGK